MRKQIDRAIDAGNYTLAKELIEKTQMNDLAHWTQYHMLNYHSLQGRLASKGAKELKDEFKTLEEYEKFWDAPSHILEYCVMKHEDRLNDEFMYWMNLGFAESKNKTNKLKEVGILGIIFLRQNSLSFKRMDAILKQMAPLGYHLDHSVLEIISDKITKRDSKHIWSLIEKDVIFHTTVAERLIKLDPLYAYSFFESSLKNRGFHDLFVFAFVKEGEFDLATKVNLSRGKSEDESAQEISDILVGLPDKIIKSKRVASKFSEWFKKVGHKYLDKIELVKKMIDDGNLNQLIVLERELSIGLSVKQSDGLALGFSKMTKRSPHDWLQGLRCNDHMSEKDMNDWVRLSGGLTEQAVEDVIFSLTTQCSPQVKTGHFWLQVFEKEGIDFSLKKKWPSSGLTTIDLIEEIKERLKDSFLMRRPLELEDGKSI